MSKRVRVEKDSLGQMDVPDTAFFGIHTLRAVHNFSLSDYTIFPIFIHAFALVKQACARVNGELNYLPQDVAQAVQQACSEIAAGQLNDQIVVDPFQGGAGTSTNMNFNEVIANRAIGILGGNKGEYTMVHPFHHVNMHQSTNDVYPTALTVAALFVLKELEDRIAGLQACFQEKEQEFADIVKVGRTELMDAVPMTLGMEFGAYAEAFARDRWRIFKCRERIKRVNLGGTAIGTGVGAPRDYILRVVACLKHLTGLPVSRAENLVDSTQNLDRFVEVSGMLKAYAVNLLKVASDLRLLGSGPDTGLGEICLPALQTGSSIMPGKVNPVLPEAVSQIALRVMGNDQTLSLAAGLGQLELNHLMPLVTHSLLESLLLLRNVTPHFTEYVRGIRAHKGHCSLHVTKSQALATALVPCLGYKEVERFVTMARQKKKSLRQVLMDQGVADAPVLDALLSPKVMCRLGFDPGEHPLKKS